MEADLRFATVRKVKQTITAANSTLQLLNDDESEELPPVCCESSNLPSSFKIDFDFSSLTQVINNFGNLSQNLLWDDVCKDHDENCMAFSDNEHRGKSQLNTMAQQKGISTRFTFPNPSFPPFHIRGQGKGSIAQNSRSKTARPVRCPAGGKNLSMDLTCPIRRPRQFPVASRPTSSVLPINASTAVSELVIASHIESPVHFYVRYCADYNLYFQWNKVLQSTCERVTHLPDSIALGQFLCVRSLIDDSWYRARILALTKVGDETESHGYHCLEDKTQSSCSTSRNEDMDNDAHDYTCPIACPETTSSAILEIARDACTFFLESPDECGKMIKCSEVNTDLKNDLSYLQPEDETMSREWNGEKNDDMSDLVATQLMNCIDKTTEEAHTKHSVIQAKTREELEIEIINGLTNFEEAEFTLCAHHGVVPQQELENCGKKWCGYQEAVPLDSVLQLECFLLDHGRKEIFNCRVPLDATHATAGFHKNRICRIPEDLASKFYQLPPAAVRCALKDIVPAHTWSVWNSETCALFKNMVLGNIVHLMKFGYGATGELLVDLRRPPFSLEDNLPLSIRDALVLLHVCRFKTPLSVPSPPTPASLQCIAPPIPLCLFQWFDVVICHVQKLSLFFIHKLEFETNTVFHNMMLKLQEFGDRRSSQHGWASVGPHFVGLHCAARFPSDNGWYRARIIDVLSGNKVKVQYVDYGNVEVIPASELQELPNEFCNLPEQAVCCCLYGVVSGGRKEAQMMMAFDDRLLACYVKGVRKDGVWKVELFNLCHDGDSSCLNSVFRAKYQDQKARFAESQVMLETGEMVCPSQAKITIMKRAAPDFTDYEEDSKDLDNREDSTLLADGVASQAKITILKRAPPDATNYEDVKTLDNLQNSTLLADGVTFSNSLYQANENVDPYGFEFARSEDQPVLTRRDKTGFNKPLPEVPEDVSPLPLLVKNTFETNGEEGTMIAFFQKKSQTQSLEAQIKFMASLSQSYVGSSNEARGTQSGSWHRVRVSHVESPSHFCVQSESWCDGALERMQKTLRSDTKAQSTNNDNPDTPTGSLPLTEGLLYSAVSFQQNALVRVQIKHVDDDGKIELTATKAVTFRPVSDFSSTSSGR